MSLFYIKVILFVVSLCAASVLAFLETAFTALRLFKLKELTSRKKRYAHLFEIWESSPRSILITILVANNLAHVLCSVLITDIMQSLLGDTGFALIIGVLTATVIILVIGEIIPKSYAKERYERIFGATIWIVYVLYYLLKPFVNILIRISDFSLRRKGSVSVSEMVTEKEIRFLIDYSDKKKLMESEKTEMLQNVFTLGQTIAKEIMIPVTDIVCIDVNTSLEDAMALFLKFRYTRLPVFEKKEDNIIGLLHQKDLFEILYKKQQKSLRDLVIPTLFIPETKKVNFLLNELLSKRIHMAILIDEHGAVTGLVTLEDIIEEIVGDISDEHEVVHQEIVPLEEGGWLIDARVDLEEVAKQLKISFDVEESITLAGFMAEKLQHIPKKGERVLHQRYCFQVQRASSRRVYQVLVFSEKSEGN
jgi:putative hemolysin